MSQYLHIFVRKNDEFSPIGTFGGGSQFYRALSSYAPWEKVAPIGSGELNAAIDNINSAIEENNAAIHRACDERHQVMGSPNTLEEKLSYIHEYIDSYIRECEEENIELQYAAYFINFLARIVNDAAYIDGIDEDHYIYVGIECGYNIVPEDVEE